MKRFCTHINRTAFLITALIILLNTSVYSASKKKKNKSNTSGQVKTTYQAEESSENSSQLETVKLSTPKRTFFSKIDAEILAGVENGSPDSLRLAMSKLRKNESEYEENEKILIAISTEIMKTLWPSEKITWDTFPVSSDNPYMGAIDSANKGVFDSSTGNTDFLSSILPALVLLKPTSSPDVYEPCESSIKLALQKNSNSVMANYLMGKLFSKKKQSDKSIPYYKKAYESTNNCKEVIFAYAEALRLSGDLESADKILANYKTQDENDLALLKQKAYMAFDKKDYNSAEEYVARVLQQNPNDLEFLLFRAKILIEKNDYIHAVSLLDMYARQENSSLEYLLLRAKVQLDWSKNTSAATETIEKAIQLYPDSEEVFMVAARIASAIDGPIAGYYADELAKKILEKNPKNIDALSYSLIGFIQRGNWQEAYNICNKIFEMGQTSVDVMLNYVTICINLGKENEAFDYAKKCLQENPEDERVLQTYIYAYSTVGNRDEVLKYINSTLDSSSTRIKSYLYYRRSFLQSSEEAILADLRSSLISNPRNSESLFRLYEIYFNKKDYRKAQYYLRQVVAINPNDASAKKLNEELTILLNQ
ncbi:MAG: tetratricopeptide repeat protein [Treponema sp.]|nr:tetratricopeptide repeat protein [Treponema sp.]